MNRRKKIAVVAMLAVLALLAGCTQKVTAKSCKGDQCTLTYTQYNKDGGKIKDRTLKVNRETFERCSVGEKWPDCDRSDPRSGQRNIPAPEDKDADRSNRTARLVCVQSNSAPRVRLTYGWRLGSNPDQQQTKETVFFKECKILRVGESAYLVVEHHTQKSTVECKIVMHRGAKQVVLKERFAYDLGDCKVEATVPA